MERAVIQRMPNRGGMGRALALREDYDVAGVRALARVGQKTRLKRRWARRGTRPRAGTIYRLLCLNPSLLGDT